MLPRVDNVVLYVDDAVRYDFAADRLAGIGRTHKSTAASVHTPASFGSIFTGRHVPNHGITGFHTALSAHVQSIFDLPDHEVSLSPKGGLNDSIARMYPSANRGSLEATDPSFVWLIRGPGGHAPYDGYDRETFEFANETGREYLYRVAGDARQFREDYERGVDAGIDDFQRILHILERAGVSDETLAIYTSDHGELLGEYGLLGHNHVSCPELAYVPTTFVHPAIDDGRDERTVRNIDILPTIRTALGYDRPESGTDGTTVEALTPSEVGYTHYEQRFYSVPYVEPDRTVRGVWGRDGGHAFVDSSRTASLLTYLGVLLKSHCGKQIRSEGAYRSAFRRFMPGQTAYGTLPMSAEAARGICERIREGRRSTEASVRPVDEDHLRDLGYL